MIKKTYIPGKPRNPKLGTATGTSGVGKTEFNQVAGSSHEHYNKGVLDRITEAMLVGALRDLITSTDTESELTDENILSALRVLSEISKANADLLEDIKNKFLSKIEPDTAQKLIKFVEGVEVGTFTTGALGSGAAIKMVNGTSYAEVDHLTVRQKATFRELIIEALKHIGGQLVLSPARMKCNKVVDGGTYYKCYFDTGDGEVSNEFVTGDQARCQVFTGSGTKFYWRLVTSVGTDWINLSKSDAVVGSDAPASGDDISQLGNRTDITRQSAIILSTVGADAPSWKQYSGINSFDLASKETTVFTRLGNRIQGKTVFTSGGSNLEDVLDGVGSDIQDTQAAANAAALKAQQAIEDAEANVTDYNAKFAAVQAQIDGEVSNWFYPYSPTLANYPASDWTTNEIKDRHIGDTFTNTAQAPATDAGKSWRFVKNGTVYSWTQIADSDAVLALQKAAQAQSTADGKSTTFLIQPTSYKLGDMWVLNADQTINGTAYKQGDILTATQDSTTFNEAHWLKRVRYTDDTAVNELEIGGRNYLRNSSTTKHVEAGAATAHFNWFDVNALKGKIISFSMEVSNVVGFTQMHIGIYNLTKLYLSTEFTKCDIVNGKVKREGMPIPNTTDSFAVIVYAGLYGQTSGNSYDFKHEKTEIGNKATDWTEAPEDVQAKINTAKQEALTAAGNAQTTANSLKDFTDTAFRDGIIDRSESVAIEKYKNSLNEAMSKAEASYNKVFANTYLPEGTAKTALLNAKVNLWGQRDTLLSAINTAISGGTTTPAQKTAVDNAFSTFNNLMTAFQNALEEANKAIQDKLKGFSDTAQTTGNNAQTLAERAQLKADGYMAFRYVRDYISGNTVNWNNQWNEIKIFNKAGTNLALGKTPSSNATLSNPATITDGVLTTGNAIINASQTLNYVQIDLGQTHYDIDYIQVWHYYLDGRTYYGTKTEISEDGVNWTTIFDSAVEGTYAETAEGKIHTQRYASVMDRIAETEAKTKFQTMIDQGLIYTALMKLFDTISGDETAFISGKQGSGKNLPAFGAGGSYQDALAGLAKIIFRHDGTGKIGVFEVDEIGSVKIYDPDIADLLRLEFVKSKVPTVASLMSQTEKGQSVTNAAKIFMSSGSAVLPNSINVTEEGAELSFSGTMELDVTFDELDGATSGSAYVGVALYKDGYNYANLGALDSGQLSNSNYSYSNSVQINKKLTVPKGVYTIVVSGSFSNALGSAGINNTSTLSWILRKDIRRFIFGSDGFASWYTENSFHFSELTGMFARGKVDIPAGLGGGSSSAGGTSGRWGMVTGATRSSSTTTITHSVGDLKYTVMVTPSGSSATWYMQNKTVNSVQIISSGAFDYILVRTPN